MEDIFQTVDYTNSPHGPEFPLPMLSLFKDEFFFVATRVNGQTIFMDKKLSFIEVPMQEVKNDLLDFVCSEGEALFLDLATHQSNIKSYKSEDSFRNDAVKALKDNTCKIFKLGKYYFATTLKNESFVVSVDLSKNMAGIAILDNRDVFIGGISCEDALLPATTEK